MLPRNPFASSRVGNSDADNADMGTPAGTRRFALLSGELIVCAILVGIAALIFSSSMMDDNQPDSSKPVVANFPAELVQSVAFSPDGKTLAACGLDHALRLWNLDKVGSGDRIKPTIIEHDTPLMAVAFAPDGKSLATAGERSVVVWSCESGRCTTSRELVSETVRCLAFSPDGQTLALGCDDGSVRLWDMPEGRERAALLAHADIVRSVSFSPDSRRLVSTSQDRLVMLWDTAKGVAIRPLGLDIKGPNPVRFAAFSPDGTYVAVGEVAGSPTEIILLSAETGKLRGRLTGLTAGINALAFSPDGRTLAAAGVDRSIKIWNLSQQREEITVDQQVGFVKSLAFSGDGGWLAFAGSDDTIKIWDVKRRKAVVVGQEGTPPSRHGVDRG